MTRLFILLAGLATLLAPAWGEEVRVGLEPFPPLVTEDGGGYSIEMLRRVERISDLRFEIKIMPYSRAKTQLKNNRIDLIGHTPRGLEDSTFYQYAEELAWEMPIAGDFYSLSPKYLTADLPTSARIGTPLGNAEFLSSRFGIPVEQFHEGRLGNLIEMLRLGRIQVVVFERASTMAEIRSRRIEGVLYKTTGATPPVGFAVQQTRAGKRLKRKLDDLFKTVGQEDVFAGYLPYTMLPDSGVVSMDPERR